MPDLSDKVSTALQEVRILILGSELLLGFQGHAVFRPKFATLPASLQALDGVAYALILATAILFLSPGSFHRLAEHADDTARLHRFTTRIAEIGLLPFGVCLGLDEFLIASVVAPASEAITIGCLLTLAAILAWYGIGLMRRRRRRASRLEEVVNTPIDEKIRTLGTEIRVVLPGAQALLGFQFAAFFTDAFDKLTDASKAIHFASTTVMTIVVILLMAPAAFHRIATGGDNAREVHVFGSHSMLWAMTFLALSMAGECYVIIETTMKSTAIALSASLIALALAYGLWFVFPFLVRRRGVRVG
jgi:hypothetical protein